MTTLYRAPVAEGDAGVAIMEVNGGIVQPSDGAWDRDGIRQLWQLPAPSPRRGATCSSLHLPLFLPPFAAANHSTAAVARLR